MKRLFSLLLICCALQAYSQPRGNKPIDRLAQKMIESFKKYDTSKNLVRHIAMAAIDAFDPPAAPFLDAWKEQEQLHPDWSMLKTMGRITDSAFDRFLVYLWNRTDFEIKGYEDMMYEYKRAMCPCITARLPAKEPWKKYFTVLNACEDSLRKDKKYFKKFSELAQKVPVADQKRMTYLLEKCTFLRCVPLKDAVMAYADKVITDRYEDQSYRVADYMFRWPAYYYDKKMIDSLKILFPNYKKFETDLKSAALMDNIEYIVSEGPTPYSNTEGNKLITFYSVISGPAKIEGQLLVTYTRKVETTLTSYTFTPGSKVKNIAELQKRIEGEIVAQLLRTPLGDLDMDDGF
jgi:hypothetical protein